MSDPITDQEIDMQAEEQKSRTQLHRLLMAERAMNLQTYDRTLWFKADEFYLQESLRDLHAVIESGDINAFERIHKRTEDANQKPVPPEGAA